MPYIAARPLTVDGKRYEPGEVIPGAEGWLRVESRVATGRIKWVDAPEPTVTKSTAKPSSKKAATQ